MRPAAAVVAVVVLTAVGCTDVNDMSRQPYERPYAPSSVPADGGSARPAVPGTVARPMPGDQWVTTAGAAGSEPPAVNAALLERGRQRFDIYCSPCHGTDGYGRGMIVQRGYPAPPSLHAPDLVAASDGHILDVIVRGLGKMPPYGGLVRGRDRWAVVVYVRALQLSQDATVDLVPSDRRAVLDADPGGDHD